MVVDFYHPSHRLKACKDTGFGHCCSFHMLASFQLLPGLSGQFFFFYPEFVVVISRIFGLIQATLPCEELTHWKRPWCWEGMKLQYFGHLMQRTDSLAKTLILGKTEGKRKKGWQRMRWSKQHYRLNGQEFVQTPRDNVGQRNLACCSHGVAKSWTWLSDWTTATTY